MKYLVLIVVACALQACATKDDVLSFPLVNDILADVRKEFNTPLPE